MRVPGARLAQLFLAIAGILALGTAVAGARDTAATSPQIREGGTIVIGLAEDPDVLDPTLARTFVGRMVFLHMCEKLYDLDSKLNIVPQLAAALPQISKDKLTYTIKVRTGIKFNDGTALTAAAVKQSLERHLTFKGSTRVSEISPIGSVDVSGSSVVLHLKQPFSPLTAQLADRAGMIMSPKALADHGDTFGTNPVCVGAFMFKERVAGDHITLVKSPSLLRQGEGSRRHAALPDHDRPELAHPEPAGRRHPGRRPRPVDRRAGAAEGHGRHRDQGPDASATRA